MIDVGPTTIVVGIDGSATSMRAARFARTYADARGLRVVGIVVATDVLGLGRDDTVDTKTHDALVAKVSEALTEAGLVLDSLSVGIGHPAEVLTSLASPSAALIVGARGIGGFSALLLGSTTSACLAHARCPVFVIPHQDRAPEVPYGRICVGIDRSAGAIAALRWAVDEASTRPGCEVHAISAWRTPHLWEPLQGSPEHYEGRARHDLEAAMRALGDVPVIVTSATKEANAAQALIEESARSDLVVLGNDRREGGRFDASATPVAVASHSSSPVVIVP